MKSRSITNVWHRISHWEYWPLWLVYLPVFIRYGFDSVRLRSPFYFTVVNPEIEAGGLFGASKYRQLKALPESIIPKTLIFEAGTPFEDIKKSIIHQKQDYPLIVKPDKAERGRGICLCTCENKLKEAISRQTDDYLVQEYVAFPCEAGVFVIDMPAEGMKVVSLTKKAFLSVSGNGIDDVRTLLSRNQRARMAGYPERLKDKSLLDYLPLEDEEVLIEAIGNHNRGTAFLDACGDITKALQNEAHRIAELLPQFHYGRLDIRCPSEEDLMNGTNWKVLEVNGVNAEPAHIYQAGYPLFKAWKTLLWHWKMIATIAENQQKSGYKFNTYTETRQHWRNAQKARKSSC